MVYPKSRLENVYANPHNKELYSLHRDLSLQAGVQESASGTVVIANKARKEFISMNPARFHTYHHTSTLQLGSPLRLEFISS
jgi:hypothetical protein